jgi:hypothetical protein
MNKQRPAHYSTVKQTHLMFIQKVKTDAALALKESKADLEANSYTKTQIDNKFTTAATGGTVSLDNYYTKTQIDASLATKENVSDFNLTLLNYYTRNRHGD